MRFFGGQKFVYKLQKECSQLQCMICIIQQLAVRKNKDNQEDKANSISRNYIKLMYNLYKTITKYKYMNCWHELPIQINRCSFANNLPMKMEKILYWPLSRYVFFTHS